MKQSGRKTSAGQAEKKSESKVRVRPAGKKAAVKRKRRKKLSTEDKIRVVLVSAVLILAASVSVLAVAYVHSVKLGNEAAAENSRTDAVPGGGGARPAPETGSPLARAPGARADPAVSSGAPAVNAPAVKSEPPPVKPPPPANSRPAATAAPPSARAVSPEARTTPVRAAPPPAAENPPARTALPPARQSPPPESRSLPAASLPPAGTIERPVSKGVLAFVIDDAGHNLRDLEPFLKFPGQLTIAVLPGLPHSAEAARRVRAAGKEVFLHQPMEALGGQNPGPGAIRAGMGRDEIRAIISRNLDELWPVAGMNNHEGSRITMDDEAMETVLSVCRERGIIFLDSRTTTDTAAPRAARRLGITIGERDVFVDNVQERKSMETYIDTGLRKAGQQGFAIMIGHVWSPELAPLLSDLFPALSGGGYSFFPASTTIGGVGR